MNKFIFIVLILFFLCGCSTVGRFSLIDLDFRSADQIKAYEKEAAVYAGYKENETVVAKETFSVSTITKIIESIKGRIRIFAIEWKEVKGDK